MHMYVNSSKPIRRTTMITIPKDFPVQPLQPNEKAGFRSTCRVCNLSWDDAIATSYTPSPAARCPFEYFHKEEKTRKRSGISIDRSYRIQEKMKGRIADIYSTAKHFHQTHETILEKMKAQVWESPELKKAPSHVRSYLSGYLAAISNQLWQNNMAWMLSCDGKPMTNKEVDLLTEQEKKFPPIRYKGEEYKSPWSRIDGDKSRHVWKNASGNPILDKPFNAKFLPVSDKDLVVALKTAPWEVKQACVSETTANLFDKS